MNGILRNVILTSALATAVTGTIPLLPAQSANAIVIPSRRIQFAPSRDSETLNGYSGSQNTQSYVFNAMAGQQTYISVSSPNAQPVVLTVFGVDGTPLVNGLMSGSQSWNGRLPLSEDYFIRVTNPSRVPTSYHLNVSILPPAVSHSPFVNF